MNKIYVLLVVICLQTVCDCKCKTGYIQCNYSDECVYADLACYGWKKCPDNTFPEACRDIVCQKGYIKCNDQLQCINADLVCHLKEHCIDKSIPKACKAFECPEYEVKCLDGNKCIHEEELCDGKSSCLDSSDEYKDFCRGHKCSWGYTKCDDGLQCIPEKKICDGTINCRDRSDENADMCSGYRCFRDWVKCSDGLQCIKLESLCNGEAKCNDGTDGYNGACKAREDWFNWGPWSKCSKTCEGGIRTRSHLHANVAGNVTSVEGCHNFGCNDIALNCNGWKTKGLLDSQTALIEPMASNGIQLQAVHIYCDMEMENGVGVTVIDHDGERDVSVHGYEAQGSYSFIVTYNIPFEYVVAIINSSQFCRQFVRWKCKGAQMYNPGNQKWNTYWTNRSTAYLAINEYKPPSVFFHGSEERRICDCGISQTCHRSDVLCNCDINDGIWRSDEGYVTNKDALPIVAFFAGDTGSAQEEGKHFIGPIECYGDA